MTGTDDVQKAAHHVLSALGEVGANMHRFAGGPSERFRAAYAENARGDNVTAARAALMLAMRDDVTVPHLPE